jgi:hypothetical protein
VSETTVSVTLCESVAAAAAMAERLSSAAEVCFALSVHTSLMVLPSCTVAFAVDKQHRSSSTWPVHHWIARCPGRSGSSLRFKHAPSQTERVCESERDTHTHTHTHTGRSHPRYTLSHRYDTTSLYSHTVWTPKTIQQSKTSHENGELVAGSRKPAVCELHCL